MGDLRGALVDFADLEDTVVVVDIPSLYQLLQFRQALCGIYFTRAGLRPGAPAGIGPGRGRRVYYQLFVPGENVDSNRTTGNAMAYGMGTAEGRALGRV